MKPAPEKVFSGFSINKASSTLKNTSLLQSTEQTPNKTQSKITNNRISVSQQASIKNEGKRSKDKNDTKIENHTLDPSAILEKPISTNLPNQQPIKAELNKIQQKLTINKGNVSKQIQVKNSDKIPQSNSNSNSEKATETHNFSQTIKPSDKSFKNIKQMQPTIRPKSSISINNIQQLNSSKKSVKDDQGNINCKQIAQEIKRKQKDTKVQDQNYEETKVEEQLDQYSEQQATLASKFFEILSDKLSFEIASYLSINDLITFACLSKKARKLIPLVMSSNKDTFTNLNEQFSWSNETCTVSALHRLKGQYQQLTKSSLPELEMIFSNFKVYKIPFQDTVLEILAVGASYSSNTVKQKANIVEYIKEKGIRRSFQGINLNYVTSVKSKLNLPQYPNLHDNDFSKLVKLIHQYVEYKQANKLSIEKQKSIYQKIQINDSRQKYVRTSNKVMSMYQKSILRLGNGNQIFEFSNKNTISVIVSFLKLQELVCLMSTGKLMKNMINQILQDQLVQIKGIRELKLKKVGLSHELVSSIIYLKHFNLFQEEGHYRIENRYNSPTFKSIFFVLNRFLSLEVIVEDKKLYPNPFKINYQFKDDILTPERITILYDFMKLHPTLSMIKEQIIQEKLTDSGIQRDCILIYQSMLGLIGLVKLNQNNESRMKAENAYNKYLFSLDAKIHYFEKLIGMNEEDFQIFFKKRSHQLFFGKCSAKPIVKYYRRPTENIEEVIPGSLTQNEQSSFLDLINPEE